MKRAVLLLILPLVLTLLPLRAEVFSLWPFGASGAADGEKNEEKIAAEFLSAKGFWSEPLRINGSEMTMKIALSDLRIDAVHAALPKLFPNAGVAGNADTLFLSIPRKDGSQARICLVQMPGMNSLLMFSMELPKNRAKVCPESLWPKDFPIPADAKELNLIEFPLRNAAFATCSVPAEKTATVSTEIAAALRSRGWTPSGSGGENALGPNAGEVYLKSSPESILVFGAMRNKFYDKVDVSFYRRVDAKQ